MSYVGTMASPGLGLRLADQGRNMSPTLGFSNLDGSVKTLRLDVLLHPILRR
jgi:phage-related protein